MKNGFPFLCLLNGSVYLAQAGKTSIDKSGFASSLPPPEDGGPVASFLLISCQFLSLPGNVKKLSRKINGGWVKTLPRSLEERIKYYTQMSCKISYIMYFLFNAFRQIIYLKIADLQCCVYTLFFPSFHCGNK